jgi:hypothetical protein
VWLWGRFGADRERNLPQNPNGRREGTRDAVRDGPDGVNFERRESTRDAARDGPEGVTVERTEAPPGLRPIYD